MREYLERVRETSPLIHNITNYVTVNDCANILLACGGSLLWRTIRRGGRDHIYLRRIKH